MSVGAMIMRCAALDLIDDCAAKRMWINYTRRGWRKGEPFDGKMEKETPHLIQRSFEMLIEEELPDAVGKMKQFASWFTHGVPGGAALRKAIYDSKSAPEILTRVEGFFEEKLYGAGASPAYCEVL